MNIGDLESMNELMIWFKESEIWASVDASFTLVSIILTASTLFFSFRNWRNNKKQKKVSLEKIKIYFEVDSIVENEHRFEIIRKFFTRAEIAGVLSFLQKDSRDRYNINYLMTQKFFDDINKVQNNKSNFIIIKISNKQQQKFNKIEK